MESDVSGSAAQKHGQEAGFFLPATILQTSIFPCLFFNEAASFIVSNPRFSRDDNFRRALRQKRKREARGLFQLAMACVHGTSGKVEDWDSGEDAAIEAAWLGHVPAKAMCLFYGWGGYKMDKLHAVAIFKTQMLSRAAEAAASASGRSTELCPWSPWYLYFCVKNSIAGCKPDPQVQRSLLRYAIRRNNGAAMYEMAIRCVRKCEEDANPNKSSRKPTQNAFFSYRDGLIGLQEDASRHLELLQQSARTGCAAARRDLGEMLEWGGGTVQKDEAKALQMYKVGLVVAQEATARPRNMARETRLNFYPH